MAKDFCWMFEVNPKWHVRIARATGWVISVNVLDYYFKADTDIYDVSAQHVK